MTLRQEEGPLCLKSWKSRSSIAWGHGRNVFLSFVSFKQQTILSFLVTFSIDTRAGRRFVIGEILGLSSSRETDSGNVFHEELRRETRLWALSNATPGSCQELLQEPVPIDSVFREAIRNIKNIQKLFVSVLVLNFHFGVARCKLESLNWHLSPWNPSRLTTTAVFGIELQLQSCLTCTIHNRVGQSWKRSWRARSRFPSAWAPVLIAKKAYGTTTEYTAYLFIHLYCMLWLPMCFHD